MAQRKHDKRMQKHPRRSAFTLIELMLSLALIVVATGLIGYIMQMYSRDFETRADDIRRQQLARAILNMIADDIRAVVLEQEYDGSVLEQQLGAGGGGESAPADPAASTGLASDFSDPAATDGAAPVDGDLTDATTAYPPGIFGDQFTLLMDVSRLPRPDEYLVQQTSALDGTLTDVPGDIKSVLYYVQSESTNGVADELNVFSGAGSLAPEDSASGGLVRRALDRAVTAYAEETGDTDRLQRTGELVAPEVVSLEFAYFDGTEGQWVYEWDSSTQSLPWLIQISLAMQSATGAEKGLASPGMPIQDLTIDAQRTYGIEIYELIVAIPGANLIAADAAAAEAAAGMEAVGL